MELSLKPVKALLDLGLRASLRANAKDFWRKQASNHQVVGGGWASEVCRLIKEREKYILSKS